MDHSYVCIAATDTVLNPFVPPKEKADGEDIQLQDTTSVVSVEVLSTLAVQLLGWPLQCEILWCSIMALRNEMCERQALMTSSGMLPYVVEDVVARTRTTLYELEGVVVEGPFEEVPRFSWTWSMTISNGLSWIYIEVSYDPAFGLEVRVTLQCIFLPTYEETGPSLESQELIQSTLAADFDPWTLLDAPLNGLSRRMLTEAPDDDAFNLKVLVTPTWSRITAFGKFTEIVQRYFSDLQLYFVC